jgi:hypothetical protein
MGSLESIYLYSCLIEKGITNVAIYGLRAMRDERLNRLFNQSKYSKRGCEQM